MGTGEKFYTKSKGAKDQQQKLQIYIFYINAYILNLRVLIMFILYLILTLLQKEQTQIRQLLQELPDQSTPFAYGNISDRVLVDLTNNFFVLCTNMKV